MTTYQLYRLILKLYTIILLFTYLLGTLDLLLLLDAELNSTHLNLQARGRGTRGAPHGGFGRGRGVADEWLANNPGWGAGSSTAAQSTSCSQGSGARSGRPFGFTDRSPSRSPSPPPRTRRARIESDEEGEAQQEKENDKGEEEGSRAGEGEGDDDDDCSVVRIVRPKPDLVPLVGPRPSESLDPALRALGRRPISEFKKPRPIKRDPEKADKDILPDTTTAPKVSRKTMVTRKHPWSHDINGHYLQKMVSSISFSFSLPYPSLVNVPKFTKS